MIYTKYSKIYGSFIKHEVSLDKDQRESPSAYRNGKLFSLKNSIKNIKDYYQKNS